MGSDLLLNSLNVEGKKSEKNYDSQFQLHILVKYSKVQLYRQIQLIGSALRCA